MTATYEAAEDEDDFEEKLLELVLQATEADDAPVTSVQEISINLTTLNPKRHKQTGTMTSCRPPDAFQDYFADITGYTLHDGGTRQNLYISCTDVANKISYINNYFG